MRPRLVLFDFDGTLINADSFWLMIRYNQSFFKIIAGAFLYAIPFLLSLGNIEKKGRVKEKVFGFFFRGIPVQEFYNYCNNILPYLNNAVNKEMIGRLQKYRNSNTTVAIVSASMPTWIKPWADQYGVDIVIGTEPEIVNGKITGKFVSKNCNGYEKVHRINQTINLDVFELSAIFGNSEGDINMMELLHQTK